MTALTTLAPTNIDSAMSLAKMMSDSTLVPVPLQKKPADCLLVIEQAIRWGMSPFAVAQCTSVVHGKLMYEGKLVAAVVNANGNLEKRLSYDYSGEGEQRTIKVSGTIKGEGERIVEVVLKDVKTSNEQWKKNVDQMLAYSGARIWARRHMPELMLGVYTPEEDIEDNRSQPSSGVTIESPAMEMRAVGPLVPAKVNFPEGDFMSFGKDFSAHIKASQTEEELNEWISHNTDSIVEMKEKAPKLFDRVAVNIDDQRRKFQ